MLHGIEPRYKHTSEDKSLLKVTPRKFEMWQVPFVSAHCYVTTSQFSCDFVDRSSSSRRSIDLRSHTKRSETLQTVHYHRLLLTFALQRDIIVRPVHQK